MLNHAGTTVAGTWLQAPVYDSLPPTIAVSDHATGIEKGKPSASKQFFVGVSTSNGSKFVTDNSNWWRWCRASCPRMSVDILETNCDQCLSMVQCCFTSTETVRFIRTELSQGPPPRLSHSSWTLKLKLYQTFLLQVPTLLTPAQIKPKSFGSRRNSFVFFFLTGADTSRSHVHTSTVLFNIISTQTFRRALTVSVDSCAEIKSVPSVA